MRRTFPILILAAAVAWPACSVCACTLPVFRYALENAKAEHYQGVVFSHGLLPADAQPLLKSLQDSPANLSVVVVDVDKPASPDALKLWQAHGAPALPWLAVSFPSSSLGGPSGADGPTGADAKSGTLAWSGALDAEGLATLLDSPARKQLRQQLLGGASVVWVLLESGDTPRDDKIAALLQTQLADLPKRLQLPPDFEASNMSQLRSGLPLKLVFSAVRVSRTAPEEKFFAALLQQTDFNPHPDTLDPVEPLVFPVFGRGRALPALKPKDLLPEKLTAVAQFLTGACSCEIQELHPGVDLLISADWETEVMVKHQHMFSGMFAGRSDASQEFSPDIAGSFVTDTSDKRPGRKYLVKVENGNKSVLETLKHYDGKNAKLTGKLVDIGQDGEAKYLFVSSVIEVSATPSVKERRSPGGL